MFASKKSADGETQKPKSLMKRFRLVAAVSLLAIIPLGFLVLEKRDAKGPASNDNTTLSQFVDNGQSICLYGCPTGAPAKNKTIERSIYILSNNPDTKFADWVAYAVTDQTIGKTQRRVWHADPDLPDDETLSPKDYKGIEDMNMDRGHQAPLSSLTGTPDWQMADFLSNITPQMTDLNEGSWEALERDERTLAQKQGVRVHSVTGPLYERAMPQLPNAHLTHKIPSGYWKVIAVVENGHVKEAAFIFDQNTPREANPADYSVKLHFVESRAHLTFFPKLDKAQKEQLEESPGELLPELIKPKTAHAAPKSRK